MKKSKRGITLIELVVVIAIIAIGAVLAIPNMGPWIANYRLRSAARDVTSTLRVAQMRAVSNNVNYRVVIDPGARTFILKRNSGGNYVDEGAMQTLPTGISVATNFGGTITFNPNSSTTPAITGQITLTGAKGNRVIQVLSSTGKITILQ